MTGIQLILACGALSCGTLGAVLLTGYLADAISLQKSTQLRQIRLLESLGLSTDADRLSPPCRWMLSLARAIEAEGQGRKQRSGRRREHADEELLISRAGLDAYLVADVLPKLRMRCAVIIGAIISLVGLCIGPLLALLFLLLGLLMGYRLPDRVMKERIAYNQRCCERELPAM